MRKTATKLTKVRVSTKVKGGGRRQKLTFWCVSWPQIGKRRSRQFFKNKTEAQTFLDQKLVEQENYGIAGVSFNERHRAEYLESAEALQPFGATIRDAVKFYIPHLQAMKRNGSGGQGTPNPKKSLLRRYLSVFRTALHSAQESGLFRR